jgi:hypothetical protein
MAIGPVRVVSERDSDAERPQTRLVCGRSVFLSTWGWEVVSPDLLPRERLAAHEVQGARLAGDSAL